MPTADPADQVLIDSFRDGDESALRILFDRHEPRLRSRIEPLLPPPLRRKVSVEDILQETYFTAYRRLDEFTSERDGAFGAWLRQIATYKLREEVRRYNETAKRGAVREVTRGARPDTVWFQGRDPSPSEAAIGEELRVQAAAALESLPPNYGKVLRLVQVEHLTLREAAERMGCTRDAAKKLYGRALNRLAGILGPDARGSRDE